MNNNFENEVLYFTELVGNNLQEAKASKNKLQAVFSNLTVKNEQEITVFNKEKNYSYTLYKKQIETFDFKNFILQGLAIRYFEQLNDYLNNKITFEELAGIRKEPPLIVKKLLMKKNNVIEQLKLLRKYRQLYEVQTYIYDLYNAKDASPYVKYLIDKYYYNKKGLTRPKKNGLETWGSKMRIHW